MLFRSSTIDIYEIIMSVLNDKDYECNRIFAFSRNLFSKQKASTKAFNKSYMVTDGKYSLMVSKQGLSLFWCQSDSNNGRNLLDFFRIVDGKVQYKNIYNNLRSSHYKYIMNSHEREKIIQMTEILLKQLHHYVYKTYERKVDDLNFNKINYSSDVCSIELICRLYVRCILKKVVFLIKKIFGIQSLANSRTGEKLHKMFR